MNGCLTKEEQEESDKLEAEWKAMGPATIVGEWPGYREFKKCVSLVGIRPPSKSDIEHCESVVHIAEAWHLGRPL